MSNVPLMFQPLVKYVDFQGRARRSEFWLWVLFRFILGAVCSSFLLSTMFSGLTWNAQNPEAFQNAFMNNYLRIAPFANIVNLINLGLLIPSIAVGVRRLHDSNRSGFWLLMPYVTFIVGIITVIVFAVIATVSSAQTGGDAHNAQAFLGVAGAFGIFVLVFLIVEIVMLVFFVSDGTAGPNRFGPDPKGRGVNPGVF